MTTKRLTLAALITVASFAVACARVVTAPCPDSPPELSCESTFELRESTIVEFEQLGEHGRGEDMLASLKRYESLFENCSSQYFDYYKAYALCLSGSKDESLEIKYRLARDGFENLSISLDRRCCYQYSAPGSTCSPMAMVTE